ncbi:unnamed protein product [Ceratitis capitata]|uniref:(Mediterranean fruit fly) hypothetical protein n=1 Tax=Ceratitis capitata TaxID=7213 RepID=A0A811UKT9_CERCA|nr:unnamed protein product [Ceratitis capitata]
MRINRPKFKLKEQLDFCLKILNYGCSKSKRKRLAWNEQSEAAILELWAERVEELRTERRNSHIYGEMANDLAKLGYNYSGRDVQVKLANFTQRYGKKCVIILFVAACFAFLQ